MSEQIKEFPISDEHRTSIITAGIVVSNAYAALQKARADFHTAVEKVMTDMGLLNQEPSGIFDMDEQVTKFIRLGDHIPFIEDQRNHCTDAGDVTGS
jgi:hypothetical protein